MAKSTAHTEAPGGSGGNFPQFQSDTFASQLFWLAITFAALYLIVARIGLPRIGSILEARQARIHGDLAEANALKSESEAAIVEYERSLAEARSRAQAIAGETRDKLNADAEMRRKALEDKLNNRLADAEKTIAAKKASAMTNVRGIAVEAAGAIVARLTGTAASEPTVVKAVDQVLKR